METPLQQTHFSPAYAVYKAIRDHFAEGYRVGRAISNRECRGDQLGDIILPRPEDVTNLMQQAYAELYRLDERDVMKQKS